ncbi:stage II sporulation protein M [Candidatus Bathyarchaeota archaeon]|nr:stage II sporulation protein M [Candidatus Bathyarchaeota archaeon]
MYVEISKYSLGKLVRLANIRSPSEARRKYCKSCGSSILYDADYCPNCGALQETPVTAPEAVRPLTGVPRIIVRRMRRIRYTLFFLSLAIFIFTFILGSTVPLSRQEAQLIYQQFNSQVGPSPTALQIFSNNMSLCLLFFIPFFGTAFMAFVGYNTGLVLSAVVIVNPQAPTSLVLAFTTLLFPWAWMEFIAYSLASSGGLMVIVSALGRTLRKEARKFLILFTVVVVLLIVGAVIEGLAISTAMAS